MVSVLVQHFILGIQMKVLLTQTALKPTQSPDPFSNLLLKMRSAVLNGTRDRFLQPACYRLCKTVAIQPTIMRTAEAIMTA